MYISKYTSVMLLILRYFNVKCRTLRYTEVKYDKVPYFTDIPKNQE